ncbi:hypothetical protein GCM10009737_32260 [Nocardioides lentus]|uniref:DUF3558 domain-containing protein n=1 Tax=Nocardioides lentus TaxID=338077 RepID=A0ABP5B2B7_9ACTN
MRVRSAALASASALLLLGACGGGGADRSDAGSDVGSSPPASSPAPSGSAGSEQEADPDTGEDADRPLPDPCALVTAAEAAEVLGSRRSSERIEGDGPTAGTVTCRFAGGPDVDDPGLDVIVSDADGADIATLTRAYGAVPGVEEEPLEVPGSDGAALLVEDDELLAVATALVLRDDVVHTVLGSAPEVDEARRVARRGVDAVFSGPRA